MSFCMGVSLARLVKHNYLAIAFIIGADRKESHLPVHEKARFYLNKEGRVDDSQGRGLAQGA